jgi:phosphosulfolactate phosphohydrolase-like enzyme
MPGFSAIYGEVYRQTVTVRNVFKPSETGILLKHTLHRSLYGEEKNQCRVLVGEREEKRPLETPKFRCDESLH